MQKLYMVLLGCTPKGRLTEQHDIFFGIERELKNLIPHFYSFWPEADNVMHIDSWREVTSVDNYKITVVPKDNKSIKSELKLFFLNLGGYKPNDLEEYHYKLLCVATSKSAAITQAKQTAFYKHTGFKGAESHIDDKYGVDVDDVFEIEEVLSEEFKSQYTLQITEDRVGEEDVLNIGYLKISRLLRK